MSQVQSDYDERCDALQIPHVTITNGSYGFAYRIMALDGSYIGYISVTPLKGFHPGAGVEG